MPVLTVIAGPNGSGKSTITARTRMRSSVTLIDPDAIARRLNPADPSRAAIQAARDAILLCRSALAERRNFVLETTLAGNGPLATIRDAMEAGFKTYVVYVALQEADLNRHRVRLRVMDGGHHVPGRRPPSALYAQLAERPGSSPHRSSCCRGRQLRIGTSAHADRAPRSDRLARPAPARVG